MKSGFLTSEFWVALASLASKIVVFYFAVRTINAADPNAPNVIINVLTPVILGVGTIWGLTHGSNTYVKSQAALRSKAMDKTPRPTDLRPPRQPGVR